MIEQEQQIQYQEQFIQKMDIQEKQEFIAGTLNKFENQNLNDFNIMKTLEKLPELKPQLSTISKKEDNLKTLKKIVKRPKVFIDNFEQFIPQLLIEINHIRPKNIIRLGQDYQIKVPRQPPYKHKYRDLRQQKIWNGSDLNLEQGNPQNQGFNEDIFKKFRQIIGQNRTEEELLQLKFQYQCTWDKLLSEIINRNVQLKKLFIQKDKNK